MSQSAMSLTIETNLGDIKIELYIDEAPKTCWNFLALAASGEYNDSKFHRNIKNFMIQGGASSKIKGGGESIWGSSFDDELHPNLRHNARGIVSMANKGPNTNKRQFFITYAPAPHLDDVYTVFGKVIYGFEVLDAMENEPTGEKDKPTNPIIIKRIKIHANPLADRPPPSI